MPPNPVPPNRFFSAVVLLSLWWPLSSSVIIQDVDLASLTVPFGAQLLGAAANDFSGRFVSAAGDTNHDGYGDIIVGAPMADHSGRTDAGICYVLFGSSAGFASVVDLATFVTGASTGFKILGAAGSDNVGNAHSGIGDVNGDGFDDVIIGAYLSDLPGRTDAGISYVIFGRDVAGGSTAFVDVDLATFVTSPSFGFRILGAAFADYSGNFVAFAGDVNADGISDIAVGATGADPSAGSRAGISYVIFGRNVSEGAAAFIDIDLSMIATLPSIGFRILGANADDHSGSPVRTVGDVNGDGIDDLIVGAHRNDSNKGTSYVIFGRNITGGAASFGDIELSLIISEPTVGFRVLGAEVDSGNRKRHSDVKHTAQYQPSIGLSNSTIFVDSQNEPSSFRSAISLFETDRCPGRTTYKNRCMWRGGPQTWNECENYCAAQGGRLLCVDSAETNAFLLTVLPNSQFITIGLNDRSSQHNYVWSGGCSPSTYRNWESGQPDTTLERCVGIAKNGKWHDIVCNSGIECGCESSWTYEPTARPTTAPTSGPTRTPTKQPSAQPTKLPTVQPSGQPTLQPSVQPTLQPTAQPSAHPDSVQLSYFNSASDLNNDGINDIIFGAYMADLSSPARLNAGIVYVVFGRNIAAGASVFGDIELSSMMTSSSTGFRILGAAVSDFTGYAVNNAGDVNGDGIEDVIVGAYGSRGAAGTSYVIYGRDVAGGATEFEDVDLSTYVSGSTVGFRIFGAAAGDHSGSSVSSAGDVNGDGVSDLIIGAYYADPANLSRPNAGVSYVIYGTPSPPTVVPTTAPSIASTIAPSTHPSTIPSRSPTTAPVVPPSAVPTRVPTFKPSRQPVLFPTRFPTREGETIAPTLQPSQASAPIATLSTIISLAGLFSNEEFDLANQQAVAIAVCKAMYITTDACKYVPPTQFLEFTERQSRKLLRGTPDQKTLAVSYNANCKIHTSLNTKAYADLGKDGVAIFQALTNVFQTSNFEAILYAAAVQTGAETVLSGTYAGKEFISVETTDPPGSSTSSSVLPMEAIIGIAAGGAALLLGLACALYYWKFYDGYKTDSANNWNFTAVVAVDNSQRIDISSRSNGFIGSNGVASSDSDDSGSFGNSRSSSFAASCKEQGIGAQSLPPSWLGDRLLRRGFDPELINKCEHYLVINEGFISEEVMGFFPQREFTDEYLAGLGLADPELHKFLLQLHSEMLVNYAPNNSGKLTCLIS